MRSLPARLIMVLQELRRAVLVIDDAEGLLK